MCPTTLNVDETLFALQFATRARNVSLGPAQRNVTAKNLLEELKELRARLREAARKKVSGTTASHPHGLGRFWSRAWRVDEFKPSERIAVLLVLCLGSCLLRTYSG